MGFFTDLFKPKKPLDVISMNPAVLSSARARATLPQTQSLIRQATGRGFAPDTSTTGQALAGISKAFGGQANVRTAARTAPQAFGQLLQPLSSQALRIKTPVHGLSRLSQKLGGPEVTYGQGIKFFGEEFAKFPVRMAAGTISTVAMLSDIARGKEVRPQDLLASSGTFFEGYFDIIAPGAAKTTLAVGIKNFKQPVLKLLLSSRLAKNVGIGAGTGLSIGLQDNVDEATVGRQITNSLSNVAIGAIIAGGIGSVLQISGKGAGGIKNAIVREVKDSFRLVKGRTVPKTPSRRVYTTKSGKPGEFRNDRYDSQAGFFNPGEIVEALGRLVGRGKQVSPDISPTKSTTGVVPPAKVGNLNMARLGVSADLKNDINSFLTKHTDTEGSPVSFNEIEKMAGELGLTPADITQTYEDAGGKLSAKILALRRLEIDAVRQATNAAKNVDVDNPQSVKQYQKLVDKVVNIANARKERVAETGRALAAQKIEAGESRNAMQALLEVAKKVDPNNRYQQEQLGQLISEAAKPTFWDKLAEFAAATKLTSIKSIERNWIGNITAPIYDPIKKLLSGTIDAVTKGVTGGQRTNFASEAIHDVAGTFSAIPRGTKNFLRALVFEEFETGATVDIGKTGRSGAIGGTLGKIIRTPFRLMNDQFFYTIAEERARRSLAHRAVKLRGATGQTAEAIYRQYYESPPMKIQAQIQKEAKEAVYREDLGVFSSKLKQALDALPFRMGKIITPFYTTPTNILRKFAREKSALGLISARNWTDIKAGGAARNEAIAKMMMGSTITFGAMSLAFRGLVTGRGPRDPAEKDLLYQSGWQPYSLWTGKGWRSYANFGEITLVLGTAADIAEVVKESKEEGDVKAGDLFARSAIIAGNSIFNQSFFTGISDALNAVADTGYGGDPTKQASRFVANLISGIVTPSALRQVGSGTDVSRKPEGIIQQVMSSIPGLRERLPEKLTQFGDEIRVNENVADAMLNPSKYTELKDDLVIQELIRLNETVGFPSRTQINVPMSQETYRDFTNIAGQETKNILEGLFKDPQYQQASEEEKKEVVKAIRDDVRSQVREGLAGEILIGGITDRRIKNTNRGWVNAMFNELITSKDWQEASQEERELTVQDIADQLDLEGVLEPELFDFI